MSSYTYSKGQWTDGNDFPQRSENEGFVEYLCRIGYGKNKLNVGPDDDPFIEIYETSDGSSFYAIVNPLGTDCYEVSIPDFPSLMVFMKEFGPAFAALSAERGQHKILDLLTKLFRVYHGHATNAVCMKCDPKEWQDIIRWREESEASHERPVQE
jgi:hypothetical protein